MTTRRTTNRNVARTAGNDVQPGSTNIILLRPAHDEKAKQDTFVLKPRAVPHAAVLTHDAIAERARTIWRERGCSPDRDEENWREAEAQLKTEMGIGNALQSQP
jgi:hypothetical protein